MSRLLAFRISRDSVIVLLLLMLVIGWRVWDMQRRVIEVEPLSEPAAVNVYRFLAAGDEVLLSRVMTLWLQQRDVQAGTYVPYRNINYQHLADWLRIALQLDSDSHYPMLLAARVYSTVPDEQRRKIMLDFVYQQFQQNPQKNWHWLAEAIVIARHGLKDHNLALKYATALAETSIDGIPDWARDLRLLVLEDMGEVEQIQMLIGGLIANKAISDPNELRFLELLLHRLQKNNNSGYQNSK